MTFFVTCAVTHSWTDISLNFYVNYIRSMFYLLMRSRCYHKCSFQLIKKKIKYPCYYSAFSKLSVQCSNIRVFVDDRRSPCALVISVSLRYGWHKHTTLRTHTDTNNNCKHDWHKFYRSPLLLCNTGNRDNAILIL